MASYQYFCLSYPPLPPPGAAAPAQIRANALLPTDAVQWLATQLRRTFQAENLGEWAESDDAALAVFAVREAGYEFEDLEAIALEILAGQVRLNRRENIRYLKRPNKLPLFAS